MTDAPLPQPDSSRMPGIIDPQGELPPLPAPGFTPARPPRFWRFKRFVSSLNPLTLFFGPVFQRDVRVSGRRKGTYVTRLIVLGIPTAFVALLFASTSRHYYGDGNSESAAARIQSLQDTAYSVAATIAWCQLITLALVAPLLTAGALVEERTARTLSAIASSPLSPGRVIGGLFAARMVNLGLLALLPLPLILAIRTFGGLETSFVMWSFAMAVCCAVALAAVGLWASTRVSRPAAAISFSILFLLLHWALPPLIVMIDSALQGWKQPSSLLPFVFSPPAALAMLQTPQFASMIGFSAEEAAAINCVLSLSIAAGALLLARWNLARLIATDRVELVRQPSRKERRRAAATGETPSDRADSSNTGAHSRTIAGNPVLWREMRHSLFASTWKRWLGIGGICLVVLVLHALTTGFARYDTEAIVIVPCVGSLILLLLSAAATPAGAVTTELEARTWATLLTTPLTTYQIMLPKALGAMRRLWPAFLFVTLHLIVCIARGIVAPGSLPFTLLHFALYAAFLSCTGVFFSLCSRKSAVASTLNIALVLGLWLVGPLFCGILIGIVGDGSSGGEKLLGIGFFSNPVVIYSIGIAGLTDGGRLSMPGFNNMDWGTFTSLWIVSLLVYAGLATLVMVFLRENFHRLSTARI